MSQIKLNIDVGIISAMYFVLFDFFILTTIDDCLSKLLCRFYYRQINSGEVLEMKSRDFPSVTSFIIGSRTSLPNILAAVVKLCVFISIFAIELGLDTDLIYQKNARHATFQFQPEDDSWDVELHKSRAKIRYGAYCHIVENGSSIIFYNSAFNHAMKSSPEQENHTFSIYDIDRKSMICLSPNVVKSSSVQPLQKVLGCSQLVSTTCTNETTIVRSAYLQNSGKNAAVEKNNLKLTFGWEIYTKSELAEIFPEFHDSEFYSNPQLNCYHSNVGPRSLNISVKYHTCLLRVEFKNNTIIEKWMYNSERKELSRKFAGPIFEGLINIGIYKRMQGSSDIFSDRNWEGLATTIVSNSLVYKTHIQNVTTLYDPKMTTIICLSSSVLTSILLGSSICLQVIMYFFLRPDKRPQINTINGLSSIAREEKNPSGNCLMSGKEIILARDPTKGISFKV